MELHRRYEVIEEPSPRMASVRHDLPICLSMVPHVAIFSSFGSEQRFMYIFVYFLLVLLT